MTRKSICTTLLAIAMAGSVSAQKEIGFSYAATGETVYLWGTNKAETYDVAIKISDQSLNGMKIKGLKVKVPENVVSNCSGWIAKELATETVDGKTHNVTDVSVDAVVANNMLIATFDEPYTIDGDVYVGYSMTIDQVVSEEGNYSGMPVAYTRQENSNSFYLRASRTYRKWENRNLSIKSTGMCSVMTVMIDGDFASNSVGISSISGAYGTPGGRIDVPITIVNHGATEVKNFTFEYELDGKKGEIVQNLAIPLPAEFNQSLNTFASVPAPAQMGQYDFSMKITKINGEANDDPGAEASCKVNVMSVKPVNRPLVEEFTGLSCGWCPLGYAAMEYMAETLKDDFIGVAYHCYTSDPMCMKSQFPGLTSALPSMRFNRTVSPKSPYFGDGEEPLGIVDMWRDCASASPIAAISVTSNWDDEERTKLTATSHIAWAMLPEDMDPQNYRVHYILVADGLQNDKWAQSNYLANQKSYAGMEGLDRFVDGAGTVYGLVYNDVPVLSCSNDHNGIAGSVSEPKLFEEQSHSYTFNLANAVNYSGSQIIQDKDNLKVVAVLLHMTDKAPYPKYGEAINACKGKAGDTVSVGETLAQREETGKVYYDINGCRVSSPARGLYIELTRYSDGSTNARKVMIR